MSEEKEKTRDEKIDSILLLESKLTRMVELFEAIESALNVFVKLGEALKWLIGLAAAFVAGWALLKGMFNGQGFYHER
jgi:hypothetical protein